MSPSQSSTKTNTKEPETNIAEPTNEVLKYKKEIAQFRYNDPGTIPCTDEELVEIIKKRIQETNSKPESEPESSDSSKDYQKERKYFENFYKDHFNEKIDLSNVKIPNLPKKKDHRDHRLIFIKKGLTIEGAFNRCKELFNAWKYTNDSLDTNITENKRNTSKHYAIWVKTGVEPDTEYLGKPTKDSDPDMKIGITLLERLILEIIYFLENKDKPENNQKHLDIMGVTFCSGSRDALAHVPGVDWRSDNSRLEVYRCNIADSHPRYGLRSAVS